MQNLRGLRVVGASVLSLTLAAVIAGCGTNDNSTANANGPSGSSTSSGAPCASASLSGAGSSFQAPMEQQWSSQYLAKCASTQVNYNSVGSGAGIQQFGSGTIDFAGSDVTMKSDEQAAADKRCGGNSAIHIPVTAGGVAVTYNLKGVSSLKLAPAVIAGIFQGTIKSWNDPKIAADNSGTALPNTPVAVFHRSDASGTTSVFSSYLAAAAGGAWTLGTGKTLNWPVGQGAKGNEGVSGGVNQTAGGVTYTEQAFAQQKNLPTASIKNAGGSFVQLSSDNVSKALDSATVSGTGNDLSMKIDYQPKDASAYPISTVSYVIVCSKYPSGFGADKVNALKGYLTYAVTEGQKQAQSLGFAPLPFGLADKAQATVGAIGAA